MGQNLKKNRFGNKIFEQSMKMTGIGKNGEQNLRSDSKNLLGCVQAIK